MFNILCTYWLNSTGSKGRKIIVVSKIELRSGCFLILHLSRWSSISRTEMRRMLLTYLPCFWGEPGTSSNLNHFAESLFYLRLPVVKVLFSQTFLDAISSFHLRVICHCMLTIWVHYGQIRNLIKGLIKSIRLKITAKDHISAKTTEAKYLGTSRGEHSKF